MRLPFTLSLYIGRQFLLSFFMVFMVIAALIMMIDGIEILRRSYSREIPLVIIGQMALLKFPLVGQKVIPFVILVASVLTFTRLTRNQELVIARSAGVSAWQFLLPAVITAFLVGVMMITIFNPLSSAMLSRYEQVEAKYLRGQISSLAISSSGLWLRQKNDAANAGIGEKGESVIHAQRAGHQEGVLYDVIILILAEGDRFIRRIDAEKAVLENDFWHLQNVIITAPNQMAQRETEFFLETNLTLHQIQDSLASPETLSFWSLGSFIDTLQEAGFSALRHRLYWHQMLASPFFYATMVIIAALFSLRLPRRGKTGVLITASAFTGFVIYFVGDLISAFALSATIPVAVAAWVPIGVIALMGMAMILHLEDG